MWFSLWWILRAPPKHFSGQSFGGFNRCVKLTISYLLLVNSKSVLGTWRIRSSRNLESDSLQDADEDADNL